MHSVPLSLDWAGDGGPARQPLTSQTPGWHFGGGQGSGMEPWDLDATW